jgi:hypothetical protein
VEATRSRGRLMMVILHMVKWTKYDLGKGLQEFAFNSTRGRDTFLAYVDGLGSNNSTGILKTQFGLLW